MDNTSKTILIAGGTFIVAVCANIVGEAIYTNSKIGVDKKNLLLATGIGMTVTFLLIRHFKTH